MFRNIILTAFLQLAIGAPAAAQDFPYPFQGLATDMAMNALHSSVLNSMLPQDDAPSAAASAPAVDTRYRAMPSVSAKAQRQFIAFIEQTSGKAGAEAVKKEFSKTSPTQLWANKVADEGLKPGDAVDAIAGYWMLNWIIANTAHDSNFDTKPVLNQVRQVLSRDASFRAMTQAQRQELSEVLMMNFLIQLAVYEDAVSTGNTLMLAQLADAAVARFRNEASVDLRALKVTQRGFAPR